jgi:Ribonuclease G/E
MSVRQTYLDRGIGEDRGVVMLDGRPERLLVRRLGEEPRLQLGARLVARVGTVETALGSAFLELGDGLQAVLAFKPDARPIRGSAVEVEIRSRPRTGKLATVRLVGAADGAPRLLEPGSTLEGTLRALVRDVAPVLGAAARDQADRAEAEALEMVHPLPDGGSLAIEPTRALTAIDVDLGERKGADAKRNARQANLTALAQAARLLRLKSLGGLVVIDLVGRGHDGAALLAAARTAFAPDNPGVAIGPVGRFGTMELSIPRRDQPLAEILCDPRGETSAQTLAFRFMRRLESEAMVQPGARLSATCAAEVASAMRALAPLLADRIGARFTISERTDWPRERLDVAAL